MARTSIISTLIATGILMASPSIGSAETVTATNSDLTSITYTWDSDELDQPKGAKRVYMRLVRQARTACAWKEQTTFQKKPYDRYCAAELTHRAVSQIGEAALLARHGRSAQYKIAVRKLGMSAIASR